METFIFTANMLVVVLAPLDLAVLAGLIEPDLQTLTVLNLAVVVVSYISYRYKKRIRVEKVQRADAKKEG
jgi:membrane protein implicated in regulation of membrane protease activity